MNNTYLITGVAGLLGSRLADYIIENEPDAKVIGIDDLSGGYKENVNPKVNFWQMDLASHPIENCFEVHKPDYVFHFAAYAAEGLSPFIRKYNYTNNLLSTAAIVNECIKHNVKRLVFTSTMAVYGHGEGGIFHEDMLRNPIDPYGIAKMGCERDIEIANEQHGLDYCIIRPHNVYGAKQNIWDKYRNVLGIWIYYLLNNQPITIFGDGTQRRAFSYIDDSLAPLFKAATEPKASKQIINLGGIHDYSINEAANILIEVTGYGEKIYLEGRHEVHTAVPTFQKSVDILGFEHKHDLKDGLVKMWEWAQQQPMRDRFVWDNYEIEKGIYSFWK
ncbi:NAD-dependent epimerase/dehydratase family protein [bacterium]|nr:NAD-dependent epimerase/dehydratase family protein [bacterium]